MKLYHGSDKIIKKPQIAKGRPHNDYGQGFYCTKHIELAREWAVSEGKDGFVNVYEIDETKLKILNLNDEYTILHWLTLLLENRSLRVPSPMAEEGLLFLHNNYHVDISDYDVVVGYRADDSYFSFARGFISNSISISQLEKAMYLGELGMQYFLRSEKAFEQVSFVDAITVSCNDYYPLKVKRDNNARNEYSRITRNMDKDGLYLMDIIRREL